MRVAAGKEVEAAACPSRVYAEVRCAVEQSAILQSQAKTVEVRKAVIHAYSIQVPYLGLGGCSDIDLNSIVGAVWKIWKEDPRAARRETQRAGTGQHEGLKSMRLVKAVNVRAGVLGNGAQDVEVFGAFVDLRVFRAAVVEDQGMMRIFLDETPAKRPKEVCAISRAVRDPVASCRGGENARAIETDIEAVIFGESQRSKDNNYCAYGAGRSKHPMPSLVYVMQG